MKQHRRWLFVKNVAGGGIRWLVAWYEHLSPTVVQVLQHDRAVEKFLARGIDNKASAWTGCNKMRRVYASEILRRLDQQLGATAARCRHFKQCRARIRRECNKTTVCAPTARPI